jgi:hypothetical protein
MDAGLLMRGGRVFAVLLFLLMILATVVRPAHAQVPDDLIPNYNWYRNCATLDLDFLNDRYLINSGTSCTGGTTYTAGSGNTGVQNFITGAGATFTRAGTNNVTDTNPPSYLDATQGQSFVSRASTATYSNSSGVLSTAAANVARSNYTYNGSSWVANSGTLIEPAATNILSTSSTFSATSGTATDTVNAATAPDGTTTATQLIESTANSRHYLSQFLPAITAGAAYSYSVFVKADARTYAFISGGKSGSPFTRGGIMVNLSNGSFTNSNVGRPTSVTNQTVIAVGNGWYRVTMTVVIDATSTDGYMEFDACTGATNSTCTYTGDGASGIYVWGSQVEAGAFPTSYIPTTGSAVTRAADVYSVPNGGTYFNSSGVMKTAPVNTPRLDHSPVSPYAAEGVLIEESRANSIRNNTMVGAVAGTPGTPPTNWSVSNPAGLTSTVVGSGVQNGINYVDVQFSGTTSGSTFVAIYFDGGTVIAASNGQIWANSFYAALSGGSLSNILYIQPFNQEITSSGTFIQSDYGTPFTPPGTLTRFNYTDTLSGGGTTAFVHPGVIVTFNTGVAVNLTLRIGLPQLELGAFPTSVIPTSGSTVTRAADAFTLPTTAGGGWYSQGVGTLAASGVVGNTAGATLVDIDDGTGNNAMAMNNGAPGGTSGVNVYNGGTYEPPGFAGSYTSGTLNKIILAFQTNSAQVAVDGALGGLDTSITIPTGLTTLRVGEGRGGGFSFPDGWINRIWYMPIRSPDASLPQYTH